MNTASGLKSVYLKLILTLLLFFVLLFGFIFVLKFYEKQIIKQIENIKNLKEEIVKKKTLNEKELKSQQFIILFEKKAGKEVSAILFDLQQKLNPDFEKTKNLLLKKINEENWKILNSSFNFEEKKMDFSLEIPLQDFNKFFNFLENETLIIKVKDLKIEKKEKNYEIQISFSLK